MTTDLESRITEAVLGLDAWFDTMRGPDGYGGPVVHWWQDCLLFTGPGLDWRYEGIITGYLNLYEKSGDDVWLVKARRAGDDLLRGQLSTGNFRNSCFEANPHTGGTPHEAACDLALLRLAQVLKTQGDDAWEKYAACAENSLFGFIVGVLWDGDRRVFRNAAHDPWFVPNKVATIVEALLAWAAVTGDHQPAEAYGRPTLQAIADCQVRAPRSALDGGIPQRATLQGPGTRLFPFYIARCVPALAQGSVAFGEQHFLEAADAAMGFVLRHMLPDGSFPQVVYANGHINRYPQWIAGIAEILHAGEVLSRHGKHASLDRTLDWLLRGQDGSGAFRTARGFAAQVSQRQPPELPEFRDVLPVCGWNSMAFRYLTGCVTRVRRLSWSHSGSTEQPCIFQGIKATCCEDAHALEVHVRGKVAYRWRKPDAWAQQAWAQV